MKNEIKIYKCEICGNRIERIYGNNTPVCCGKPMILEVPNKVEAVIEKHVPVYSRVEDEIVVSVGEKEHPMEKEHYIMWVAMVKDNIVQRVELYPEQGIAIRFKYIPGSTIYAYCNKHGLWKKDVE